MAGLLPSFNTINAASHGVLAALLVAPLLLPVPAGPNIVLTATATVFVGAWRSVKPEPPTESMTKKDAARFPLVGSAVLFSLFLAFKFLPKDLVNTVLAAYFVVLGLLALTATFEPLVAPFLTERLTVTRTWFHIPVIPKLFPEGADAACSIAEVGLGALSAAFCAWYWQSRHWFANNALGVAFSVQGIEHLSLGSTSIGVLLLSGLFFYDIFWVFFTPVMVTVARSFDAPIKLLFPRPWTAEEPEPRSSMLGLGDIVIPGIFVAIVLRYDAAHGGKIRLSAASLTGYVLGLASTIIVMNAFKAAQPALLYIVPALLGITFAWAALRGETRALFAWHEQERVDESEGGDEGATIAERVKARIAREAAAAEEEQDEARKDR